MYLSKHSNCNHNGEEDMLPICKDDMADNVVTDKVTK